MDIKATDVKALREKTGAGMLDCKNALVKAEGNPVEAEKILKELGLAAAAKRSGRATNEGRIFSAVQEEKAGLLELSCETDFVARNTDFVNYGNAILKEILEKDLKNGAPELEEKIQDAVSKIKENIALRRFSVMEKEDNEIIQDYIHGEGRIGVLVKIKAAEAKHLDQEELKQFAFDIALHIAAYNPRFLDRNSVDGAYMDEQKAIFLKQAENLGKPEKVIEGIVKGKLNKHLSEICLLNQGFVKDDKQPVEKVMKAVGDSIGGVVEIKDYIYFSVGEEIE